MKRTLIAASALALIAASCGGGNGSSGIASLEEADADQLAAGSDGVLDDVAAAEVDVDEAMLAFTQCLRDQGLDVSDPEVDADGNLRFGGRPGGGGGAGGDADRESFGAARDACADILEGVSLQFRDFDRTDIEDTLVEFASCMRNNGYDMADPDFSSFGPGNDGGPGGGGPFGDVDREDPTFISANEACEEILAAAFGDGGPGRGPGGSAGGGDGA